MERVETLCNLLAEKLRNKATINELLTTVKMLESELLHQKSILPAAEANAQAAAVNISKHFDEAPRENSNSLPAPEEKIVELLQIDEADIEAELEEIKKNAGDRNKIGMQNKPPVQYDPVDDIPTLAGRINIPAASPASPQPVAAKEIHELIPVNSTPSFNETLRKSQSELAETLQDTPVKDLKKAIGINDRYRYINDLFRGDEAMYERSIKTINSFAIFPEAEYWIRRELKLKLGWDDKNETVQQFDQLVRRRFS